MIHPAGCTGQLLLIHRNGVSVWEHQRPVIRHQHVHAQALTLLLLKAQIQRRDTGLHLCTEFVQLSPSVALALLRQISVFGKAVEAVGSGKLDPRVNQLPQDIRQHIGMLQYGLLLRIIRSLAAFAIRACHGCAQLASAEKLPLNRVFDRCRQLLILRRQPGNTCLQLLSSGVKLMIQRQQAAQLWAKGLIQRRSVGAVGNGRSQRLAVQFTIKPGQRLLKLRLVEFVGNVMEGADEGQSLTQSDLLVQRIPLQHHLYQLLRAGRSFRAAGQRIIPRLNGIYIRSFIGDIREFPVFIHKITSFPPVGYGASNKLACSQPSGRAYPGLIFL